MRGLPRTHNPELVSTCWFMPVYPTRASSLRAEGWHQVLYLYLSFVDFIVLSFRIFRELALSDTFVYKPMPYAELTNAWSATLTVFLRVPTAAVLPLTVSSRGSFPGPSENTSEKYHPGRVQWMPIEWLTSFRNQIFNWFITLLYIHLQTSAVNYRAWTFARWSVFFKYMLLWLWKCSLFTIETMENTSVKKRY